MPYRLIEAEMKQALYGELNEINERLARGGVSDADERRKDIKRKATIERELATLRRP